MEQFSPEGKEKKNDEKILLIYSRNICIAVYVSLSNDGIQCKQIVMQNKHTASSKTDKHRGVNRDFSFFAKELQVIASASSSH